MKAFPLLLVFALFSGCGGTLYPAFILHNKGDKALEVYVEKSNDLDEARSAAANRFKKYDETINLPVGASDHTYSFQIKEKYLSIGILKGDSAVSYALFENKGIKQEPLVLGGAYGAYIFFDSDHVYLSREDEVNGWTDWAKGLLIELK